MATIFWKICPDQIGSALVACLIFKSLAREAKSFGKLLLAEELKAKSRLVVLCCCIEPNTAPMQYVCMVVCQPCITGTEREQCIQLPVSHTLSDHHIPWCQASWVPCQELKFSLSTMNCMSMDSIVEVFCHFNKMLITTKHIADNFVFQ